MILQQAINLIREFEGLALSAYRDIAGVWTVGFGHTRTAREGMSISLAEAEELLDADLVEVIEGVRALVKVPVAPQQFGALVSLAFNIGLGQFSRSTVLRRLNLGDYARAADAFLMWDKATVDGVKRSVAGLTRRRQAERRLFLS